MAAGITRLMLFDKDGAALGDLMPGDLAGRCPLYEKVNGQHTLTLVTTRVLVQGTRVVFRDGMLRWHEYVVNAPDDLHARGEHATGTYGCIWSLQYDLTGVTSDGHPEPGMGGACSGAAAIACALEGTDRWGVGTVDVAAVEAGKGVVMIGKSAWERLSLVSKAWHGEVDAQIEVGPTGVTSRSVALLSHLGPTKVTRRFDWGRDVRSIRRTPEPGPYYCGIMPLGKGHTEYAEDDETTIDWPLMLTDDPEYYPEHTSNFIYDPEASLAFRVSDGHGGWEYPTKPVRYDADDVGDLYDAASADVYDQTHPKVTYESDVLQLARAGLDAKGVELGEEIHVIDYGFNPGAPLRIQGRVLEMTTYLNEPQSETHLVIGDHVLTMADALSSLISSAVAPVSDAVRAINGGTLSTVGFLANLLERINAEINATGGYTYLVPGIGAITYDTAVGDPTVGDEASRAVEMRGGTLRFANTRTSAGDWNWTNVITADGYLGLAATIARITSGYIGNPSGDMYLDFDNHEYRLGAAMTIGDRTVQDVLNGVDATITDVDVEYAQGTSATTAPTSGWSTTAPSWESGKYIWSRTKTTTGTGITAATTYSTPVMISGRDGANGSDGTGITSVKEQYYLSTSDSTQTGGSWSDTQPTWSSGKYIWTRSEITWDTTPATTTHTTPILATALTQANSEARAASTAVTTLDNSLDQSGVFNRLTNNGTLQGLYMSGGQLYVNASYIQTGALNASLITTGTLSANLITSGKIQSVNGKVYFDLSNNELHCDKLVSTNSGSNYENLSAEIASQPVYGTSRTIYGLKIKNASYSEGALTIEPPDASNKATYIYSKTGVEISSTKLSSSGNVSEESFVLVDSDTVHMASYYNSNYGNSIQLDAPKTSGSSVYGFTIGVQNSLRAYFSLPAAKITWPSYTPTFESITVSGNKNRVVETESYGQRLLSSYETPAPMFGDVGSATIGDDGTCVVSIDDVFQETARTDMAYQVFLQKCGQGDLWVVEKTPTYFVVEGTAGLAFDWHLMAHQSGYENQRLEDMARRDDSDVMGNIEINTSDPYKEELDYIRQIESLYEEAS